MKVFSLLKCLSPAPIHPDTVTPSPSLPSQGMLLFTLSVILESGKKCRACEPATEKIHHKLYQLLGE